MSQGRLRVRLLLRASSLVGLLLVACSNDDSSVDPPKVDPLPPLLFPSTPDSLILDFQQAYERRDSAAIDSLLAPSFTFVFNQAEVDSFGMSPSWGRADEVESAQRLFEGSAGRWPDGSEHPPANDFPFNTSIVPMEGTAWVAGDAEGVLVREYQVSMLINLVDFNVHFVGGTNVFEVVDMSTIGGPGGEEAFGYAILRCTDLGISNGFPMTAVQESLHLSTWGFVKAVFGS